MLAEATAIRAPTEASTERIRELFAKVVDTSISDDELDDIAKKLEGFAIAGENPVKSTGRVGVIIRKPLEDGGYLSRIVTVRREKKGWGVLDVSPQMEFKGSGVRRQTTQGTGTNY